MQHFSQNGEILIRTGETRIESTYSTRAGIIMDQGQLPKSTEQRRKLLKSALAASSVAGLGYSGSALASVTQCISNQQTTVTPQFVKSENAPSPGSNNWAWKKVTVHQYRNNGTGPRIEGFQLTSGVFQASSPWAKILLPVLADQTSFVPWTAWVIVYFDSATKTEKGAFPEYQAPGQGIAQASLNCVNSLNPGISSNYTYGG